MSGSGRSPQAMWNWVRDGRRCLRNVTFVGWYCLKGAFYKFMKTRISTWVLFIQAWCLWHMFVGGTAAAAPPPFMPSDPALCGSCPLVTPYYCRLGDLLCYSCLLYLSSFCVCMHMCNLCFLFVFCVIFLCSFLLQYFDTVGWVFWPVKTVSHITYTVLEGTENTAQSINPLRCAIKNLLTN